MNINKNNERSVAATAALYQAERSDAAAYTSTSLALVGAGAAYLVGTIALWDKFSLLKGWIVLLPFVLVCVTAFHSLLVAGAASRARSILLLEDRLKDSAGILGHADSEHIGASATERVSDVNKPRHWSFRASTIITYGGAGAIIAGYTVAILVQGAAFIGWWVVIPTIAYAGLLVVVAYSWSAPRQAAGEVPAGIETLS